MFNRLTWYANASHPARTPLKQSIFCRLFHGSAWTILTMRCRVNNRTAS